MSDDNSSTWSMRGLRRWLSTAPETRDDLLKLVQDSRQFLEPDTVDMLEGVLDLPAWHRLIKHSQNHGAGFAKVSTAGRCVSELGMSDEDIERRVVKWVKP